MFQKQNLSLKLQGPLGILISFGKDLGKPDWNFSGFFQIYNLWLEGRALPGNVRKKSRVLRHQLHSPDMERKPGASDASHFRLYGLRQGAQESLGHNSPPRRQGLSPGRPVEPEESGRGDWEDGSREVISLSHHSTDKYGAILRPQGSQTEARGCRKS